MDLGLPASLSEGWFKTLFTRAEVRSGNFDQSRSSVLLPTPPQRQFMRRLRFKVLERQDFCELAAVLRPGRRIGPVPVLT